MQILRIPSLNASSRGLFFERVLNRLLVCFSQASHPPSLSKHLSANHD